MNYLELTIVATIFECAIPIGLIILSLFKPSMRKRTLVILGSLTPILAVFIWGIVSTNIHPTAEGQWAVRAMWAMGFAAYIASLAVGVGMSMMRRPQHLFMRYCLGFATILLIVGIMAYITHRKELFGIA